jgi:peptidyl-prolyl cis-trans isomerase D
MNELADEWEQKTTTTEDSLFALTSGGSYTGTYVTEEQIVPSIADVMMNEVEVGSTYGPFVEGQVMAVAKLIDRRELADSVTLRRILRPLSVPGQQIEANRLLDSIRNVLEAEPGKFSELASEFNQDPRSIATNGLVQNVPPTQLQPAVAQVAFVTGEPGEIYKVTTPNSVQLIEIISRAPTTTPHAKVAYVTEPMIPSNDTENAARARAEAFLTGIDDLEELKAAANEAGYTVETTAPLDIGTFNIPGLGNGQDVRDMVCWAFSADQGDVSGFVYTFTDPNFFYENKYAVVGVANVLPRGEAPVAALRESLEGTVRDRLKGRKLAQALSGMDLNAAAQQYSVSIDTLNAVNFTLTTLPQGIGSEPKVIGAAAALATDQVSDPIVGNNGVYLVKPISEAPSGSSGSLPAARLAINAGSRSRVNQELIEGLRAETEIEDQRVSTECSNLR